MDFCTTTSSLEEGKGIEMPSQSDPVDKSESPPAFEINRPTTRSIPRRPTARPKCQASKKKTTRPSSSARKRPKRGDLGVQKLGLGEVFLGEVVWEFRSWATVVP